jgi:hypothetical protein
MAATATVTVTYTRARTCDTCSGIVRCACGLDRPTVSVRAVCPVPNYAPRTVFTARPRTGRGRHRRALRLGV